jgi:hypothetical protein
MLLMTAFAAGGLTFWLWVLGLFGRRPFVPRHEFGLVLAWLLVVVFAYVTIIGVKRTLSGGDLIIVDDRGIYSKLWSEDFIPWSAITAVTWRKMHHYGINYQTFLYLSLENPQKYPSTKFVRRIAGFMGERDVTITTSGTDKSIDQLADAIDQYWRSDQGSARKGVS